MNTNAPVKEETVVETFPMSSVEHIVGMIAYEGSRVRHVTKITMSKDAFRDFDSDELGKYLSDDGKKLFGIPLQISKEWSPTYNYWYRVDAE